MPYIVEYATKQKEQIHTFNLGNEKTTSVDDIAETASDVLGVDRAFMYTGGERGWTGDVPKMRLSVKKLTSLRWELNHEIPTAVRQAAEELAQEL